MKNLSQTLPGVIAEIAEVAGLDVAWAIAVAKGGQLVVIPADAADAPWLVDLVGMEAAEKVCRQFSTKDNPANLLIPMAASARRKKAWAEVLSSDMNINDIAATMGVHRRTVFRHKAVDPDQGDLF